MENKCLYCYEPLDSDQDFHPKCSRDFFGSAAAPIIPYAMAQMAELAKNVIERSIAVPGVQPKLSMTLIKATKKNATSRMTVIGELGGNYIFKPPSETYREMPENEHVTMRIAEAFGIPVVQSSLIRLQSGELSYITKRVDRTVSGEKIHMLDMFQITEAFDKYRSSMEKVGKALKTYSDNTLLDMVYLFELTCFCFLTGNNDMHLKNFSMVASSTGWLLSPAYDLLNVAIVNPSDYEELALTLEGKKRKLTSSHFERFGKELGLTDRQISNVFKRFSTNKTHADAWIEKSFLSDDMKIAYSAVVNQRYAQMDL
ncbi:HipA domain-containing protein [Parapedobacter sp. DT-150]|uniref:HipA domain-containing protein n=1 Tax=Parapedobacter sp. DT-150 TaxID=3396162 RepID=UPI003F1D75CA